MLDRLVEILHSETCSLVAENHGVVRTFCKKGVRDLMYLLDNEPEFLDGASIADKVIGKAAAGIAVSGGVRRIHADVMSRRSLPILDSAGIEYSFDTLVDRIVIPEGDSRCPLEEIVGPAETAAEVVSMLRAHFEEVQRKNMENNTNQ